MIILSYVFLGFGIFIWYRIISGKMCSTDIIFTIVDKPQVLHAILIFIQTNWLTYLHVLQEDEYPDVQLSIFIDQPTPFLPEALEDVINQDYPKKRINLFLQNQVKKSTIQSRESNNRFIQRKINENYERSLWK